MKRLARLAPVVAAALVAAAAAPPTIVPEDPQATVVADLVVRARAPGPAWWRVSAGGATVWVLGVPTALPKGLSWDRSTLKRRLADAHRVLLPPIASFGLLDIFGAFSVAAKLRVKAPFETGLPPDLAHRYAEAAA